jgi:septal ring-binding cell division protein DamX
MGNISLTNSLAEQGLKKACAQGMFQVDDELIQPQQSLEENVSLAFFQGYDFLKDNKWWLLTGILLIWVILMLLWPTVEKQEEDIADAGKLEIIIPEQEIVVPVVPEFPEPVAHPPGVQEEQQPVKQPRKESAKQQQIKPAESEPEVVQPQKRLPEKKEVVVEANRKKKIVVAEPVPEKKRESPSRDADALFNERLKASASWLAWSYRGGYTVQLMVLASENAEENLKKILIDDKYYAIKDQLYILRKTSPKTIFVYYGNYTSMEETRQARNNMPLFLREHQPYVLSIQDALKKIEE